jgi:hypothetical protein
MALAHAQVPERSFLWHGPAGTWTVITREPSVVVLDRGLRAGARFSLPSTCRGPHGVSPELTRLAVAGRDEVSLIDLRGQVLWSTRHHPWGEGGSESGSCAFDVQGQHVWATVPSKNGDVWQVLDAKNGKVLGFAPLHCNAAGSEVLIHPDGEHVGLSVGEGQDAVRIYWGSFRNGQLQVVEHDRQDRVLCDIHPSGKMFLTTPHGEGPVALHSFPSGRVVATCDPSDLDTDIEDSFDFVAAFINEEMIIAPMIESGRHVLLHTDGLRVEGFIGYPARGGTGYPLSAHDGTWVTLDGTTLTQWRFS